MSAGLLLVLVAAGKITRYLLADDHPDGRHKARFLRALGFTIDNPSILEQALLAIARHGHVAQRVDSAFGALYLMDGKLSGPVDAAWVRTVWIVVAQGGRPRFVTAFPA